MVSKGSSGQATSQGSMISGRAVNISNHGNQSRLIFMNEKEKQKPSRPELSKLNRQHKGNFICCNSIFKILFKIFWFSKSEISHTNPFYHNFIFIENRTCSILITATMSS